MSFSQNDTISDDDFENGVIVRPEMLKATSMIDIGTPMSDIANSSTEHIVRTRDLRSLSLSKVNLSKFRRVNFKSYARIRGKNSNSIN